MSRFQPADPADVAAMIESQKLGLVVSTAQDDFAVTPLPLLVETDETGQIVEFLGHFGRGNRQLRLLEQDPRALILFQGPQEYIKPQWVSDPRWAPTWNYAVASFEVEVTLSPEENDAAIRALSAALGGDDWSPDRMGDRYATMVPYVVAFRARVIRSEFKFKLGQDETDQTYDEILGGLGDAPIVAMMNKARGR